MTQKPDHDDRRLGELLVHIARDFGLQVEQSRARRLLSQAQSAWPGTPAEHGLTWLAEAAISLGLRCRVTEATLEQALDICADGGRAATFSADGSGQPILLLGVTRKGVRIAAKGAMGEETVTHRALQKQLQSQHAGVRWLVVEPQVQLSSDEHHGHDSPLKRFVSILRPEWNDIWVVLVFAFFAGVLGLATPIAVEALVNTVAFGRLLQPVVVLAMLLFGFLAFGGAMKALQTIVVEIIQRRLFARISADLAFRLPRVRQDALDHRDGPELVNRFFDVVTLQKITAYLLLDGLAIVLTTLVGMVVLAFYHPWLLGFDLVLLATVVSGVFLLGRGAVRTGIDESKHKYQLAAWLEDVIRCHRTFKLDGSVTFATDRTNYLTSRYLTARRDHFRVLLRQIVLLLGLQAAAGTILLGFGGWLVIQGQLTLGQLVAAELIVAIILGALAKLGKHLEGYYDVMAAVDKLGYLFRLPLERSGGLLHLPPGDELAVKFADVNYVLDSKAVFRTNLSLGIRQGERVAVTGGPAVGKSIFCDLLYGLRSPTTGHLEIRGTDPRDVRPDILREHVALIQNPEIFAGTIAENVQLYRPHVLLGEVRAVLDQVGLLDDVLTLPDGLDTFLCGHGGPLTSTQLPLLMLARALVGKPELLLIDGLLDNLSDNTIERVFTLLAEDPTERTVVVATSREAVKRACHTVIELHSPRAALGAADYPPFSREILK